MTAHKISCRKIMQIFLKSEEENSNIKITKEFFFSICARISLKKSFTLETWGAL